MNPHPPSTTPSYGYDRAYPSLQGMSMAFFGYDASASWFTAFNFDPAAGNTSRFRPFTGKERDSESGLDYFGARYYGSALGRFASPDPIQYSKQRVLDPQNWNMYAYGRGNPLRFMDPTGMYNTDCKSKDYKNCSQEIQDFENRRQHDLSSKDKRVRNAAKAYGSFNDGNNVNVNFDPKATQGKTIQDLAGGKLQNSFTVTLPTSGAGSSLVAHEGSHVEDKLAAMDGATPLTRFQSEIKAYETQAATLLDEPDQSGFLPLAFKATGQGGVSMILYEPTIPLIDKVNEDSIREYLSANPTYKLTPQNQGGPVYGKPHQ